METKLTQLEHIFIKLINIIKKYKLKDKHKMKSTNTKSIHLIKVILHREDMKNLEMSNRKKKKAYYNVIS